MWKLKEARLDGDRIVSTPLGYLGLPGDPDSGIAPPSGLCSSGKDAAVKSVELFAGAGGLALGTAKAGLSHKVVIEWDSNACQTLRRNHKDKVQHVRDWRMVEGLERLHRASEESNVRYNAVYQGVNAVDYGIRSDLGREPIPARHACWRQSAPPQTPRVTAWLLPLRRFNSGTYIPTN